MAIGGVILCVGDSLTYGARDEHGLHYPELLARALSVRYNQWWTGVNHGISGQTTPEILRRCYGHVRSYPEATEVFLWAGFNDAKVNVRTPPHLYLENMNSMIRSILFAGRACYLFDLPPMDGFGAPDFVDNSYIDEYNRVIEKLWERYSDQRLYPISIRDIPSHMRNDGVHLTHEGNKFVTERALAAVAGARERMGMVATGANEVVPEPEISYASAPQLKTSVKAGM